MEVGLGPGDFVSDYTLQKNSTPNAPKLLYSSKIEKKNYGKGPPHSPPPSARCLRSYGARPRRLRHLGWPPDLLTLPPPISTHLPPPMSAAKEPQSESSRERNGQGAIWPGRESARVLLADSLRGANWPGSEKARYRITL